MAWTAAARKKAQESKNKSGCSNQFTKAASLGKTIEVSAETKEKFSKVWTGRKHSDATKKIISEKALASKHRRLVRSIRKYIKKDGTVVLLDSSWEEALASRLDQIGISWDRPKEPIVWKDKYGKDRNYFPDFWLPDFSLYLDPKNPAVVTAQQEKIKWLHDNRKDVIILHSLEKCKTFCP